MSFVSYSGGLVDARPRPAFRAREAQNPDGCRIRSSVSVVTYAAAAYPPQTTRRADSDKRRQASIGCAQTASRRPIVNSRSIACTSLAKSRPPKSRESADESRSKSPRAPPIICSEADRLKCGGLQEFTMHAKIFHKRFAATVTAAITLFVL